MSLLSNLSYTFKANLLTMFVSIFLILVLPKFIGVREYGVWQLYLFYLSYVGFFHFGWLDGIYLRYGGAYYDRLDTNVFRGQWTYFCLLECLLALGGLCVVSFAGIDGFQRDVIRMVCITGLIVLLGTFANYILQVTGRIRDYAISVFANRLFFLLAVVSYLALGMTDYHGLLYIDSAAQGIALLIGLWYIRNLLRPEWMPVRRHGSEIWRNVSVGIKLLFANISNMLILGIVRFGISVAWSIEVFGQVSLALSISNFVLSFVNAASIAIFPLLRRSDPARQREMYGAAFLVMSLVFLGCFIGYYPMQLLLSFWIPQYTEALSYAAVLFPICLIEGKMGLLVNTYMKHLRKEKAMFAINGLAVLVSAGLTYVWTMVIPDVEGAVLSMVAVLLMRYVATEWYLERALEICEKRVISGEIALILFFLLGHLYGHGLACWILYVVIYMAWVWFMRKEMMKACQILGISSQLAK